MMMNTGMQYMTTNEHMMCVLLLQLVVTLSNEHLSSEIRSG